MVILGGAARHAITVLGLLGTVLAMPVAADATAPQKDPCSGVLPGAPAFRAKRPIEASDLIRLRDIGFYTGYANESPIGVSANGASIAFVISRADPSTNAYCQALVSLDLTTKRPRVLDSGGDYIPAVSYIRGNLTPNGSPSVLHPAWSPDGHWVAYLKRLHGVTQAWLIRADRSQQFAATKSDVDIESVGWSSDGRKLVYTLHPDVAKQRGQIEAQSRSGSLYDEHIVPFASAYPLVSGPAPVSYQTVDIATGNVRAASEEERAILDPLSDKGVPIGARKIARSRNGSLAWIAPRDPDRLMTTVDLWIQAPDGRRLRCDDKSCQGQLRGIEDLWWSDRGLLFLRREGWGFSQLALYRWRPGSPPRRIFATDDLLMGCQLVDGRLLCTREGSTQPRQIVSIDPVSGKRQLVFDPNPEFGTLQTSKAERLHWRNMYGLESFGDLVLPPGATRKAPLPLIIVQYISRGFLRGGTGDEYPIQLFAQHGFAVLSVQNPPLFYESLPDQPWRTWQEAEVENFRGWRERWNVLSTVLKGIDLLVERGIADRHRVGITGLSDGATTVQFGLVHSPDSFAAASVSTNFMDPDSTRIDGGLAWYAQLRSFGFPSLTRDDPAFWRNFSVAANADRIDVPILMQVPEHEFSISLESYARLKDAGRPVEMFVFDGEYHVKSQPAHRLAIYDRNLDWFDFWLKNIRTDDPAKAAQYRRWDQLRAAWLRAEPVHADVTP